ncbi:hypothetical protein [Allomuricauda sp. SCSIO 65647]|uniref:hypothetical protein n=1 Tax=Allomuricauda sp. SCSIO 65647 TaxID=2908843 RepID=UPI001F48F30E|nr:hypothetical protein [Muricauda sp. SCSIO 65647]UJH67202.1 hypothetical protein L0P89_14775 [Muricauda sp. SCSIO 65647]
MSIKVSAFHVYSHQDADDEVENCAYCDLAIANQQIEYTPVFAVAVDFQQSVEKKEPRFYVRTDTTVNNTCRSNLLSRPPPVI